MTTENTAEVSREVADVSIIEESVERVVDVAREVIEDSASELIADCTGEVENGVTGTEVAKTVEPAIVNEGSVDEGDVGPGLDEAATPKEVTRAVEEITVIDDEFGAALVATATPNDVAWTVDKAVDGEDGDGTALEDRLSALMMSAAYARILDCTNGRLNLGFYLLCNPVYDGLQMRRWDKWEDSRVHYPQILRTYTHCGVSMAWSRRKQSFQTA